MRRRGLAYRNIGGDAPSGLISWWRLEDNANDSVGSNDGTVSGAFYIDAYIGRGLSFYAGTGNITIPDNDSLSFTSKVPMSLTFWVYLDSSGKHGIFSKRDASNIEYRARFNYNDFVFEVFGSNSTSIYRRGTCSHGISTGSWNHVAITYDGDNSIKIYVNSVSKTVTFTQSGTYTGMSNTSCDLKIGNMPLSTGYNLKGDLDEVKIWNKELSQSEIDAEYALT